MNTGELMDTIQEQLTPHLREATKIIGTHWSEIIKDSEGANAVFSWIFTFFMCPASPEELIPDQIINIGTTLKSLQMEGDCLCPKKEGAD